MSVSLVLVVGCILALAGGDGEYLPALGLVCGAFAAAALAAMTEGVHDKKITAGKHCDLEGNPKAFTLSLGRETVTLDPGKPWNKVDTFKWITRGLIEEPQSYHVRADGTVDINGERIGLQDPDGAAKLEHEICKRHAAPMAHKPPAASPLASTAAAHSRTPGAGKVQFKVKLDHLGHITIECRRNTERVETGLRGLPSLVQNGFMLKPKDIHVDPLQRSIEIDQVRFECTAEGAHQLEEALNARYAAKLLDEGESAVEIKENPAASTGFDIRFVTVRAGARFEVKGHLSQENLDLLQDPGKCELIKSGIILRLSPPYLLIRRRRPDGSEERIPELPDTQYRRATALQLRRIFNHPAIRRTAVGQELVRPTDEQPAEIREMRLVRNPQNKMLLWLECGTAQGGKFEGKAFTHHNVADLQHCGVFRNELDVNLSLDHRTLSILNKQTGREEALTLDPTSPDSDLAMASRMLCAALKPPTDKPAERSTRGDARSTQTAAEPNGTMELQQPQDGPTSPAPSAPNIELGNPIGAIAEAKNLAGKSSSVSTTSLQPDASGGPELDQNVLALFGKTDPLRVNTGVFHSLAQRLGIAVQDLQLSLPRVFENRRFEVLSLSHSEISSVLELRSADFSGFYLSHNSERKILFVYGSDGRHVEFGPEKCEVQAAVATEPDEFKGSALLGMAQRKSGDFVFVVSSDFKEWSRPREKLYLEARAIFATTAEIAAAPTEYSLIWPEAGPNV